LNKTGPVEVTFRDKLNNFAHLLTGIGGMQAIINVIEIVV
jgi:hypothetical protein